MSNEEGGREAEWIEVAPLRVMKLSLSDGDLGFLLDLYDELLANEGESEDASGKLAGFIRKGAQIDLPVHPGAGGAVWARARARVLELVVAMARRYVVGASSYVDRVAEMWADFDVRPASMWFVKQLHGDFNPVHTHSTTLSGIIYLRVPDQINEENYPAGYLGLIHGRSWDPLRFDFGGCRTVRPVAGDCYVFPSWLSHVVYPFEGSGERVCLPFNVWAAPVSKNRRP